jgi:hypothetical protein
MRISDAELKARLELLAATVGLWAYDEPRWRDRDEVQRELERLGRETDPCELVGGGHDES